MKYFVTVLFAFSFLAQAHELPYGSYLLLQESLASGNFEASQKAWRTVCDKEIGHYAKDYSFKDCHKSIKSIEELRNSFKSLSEIYIKNGESIKNNEILIVKCPMASARWLQKKGEIKNPYYGVKMLRCGEIEK